MTLALMTMAVVMMMLFHFCFDSMGAERKSKD